MNDSLTHIPKYLSSADVCYSEELKTLPVHKHRGDLFIFLRANFDVDVYLRPIASGTLTLNVLLKEVKLLHAIA